MVCTDQGQMRRSPEHFNDPMTQWFNEASLGFSNRSVGEVKAILHPPISGWFGNCGRINGSRKGAGAQGKEQPLSAGRSGPIAGVVTGNDVARQTRSNSVPSCLPLTREEYRDSTLRVVDLLRSLPWDIVGHYCNGCVIYDTF